MAYNLSFAARRQAAKDELAKLGIGPFRDFFRLATQSMDRIETLGGMDARCVDQKQFEDARTLMFNGILVFTPTGSPTGRPNDRSTATLTEREREQLSDLRQRATRLLLLS